MSGVTWQIRQGDCRDVLRTLPERSVQTCVTSPPYFGLRDYGVAGQRGAEETPDEFVDALAADFRLLRRVLRDDGTVWLNLGDSYWSADAKQPARPAWAVPRVSLGRDGIKPKDLIGIPWMVAFALRADGWYLRSEIIWHKPNPMPESVTDRPTKAHEYLFLLSKRPSYFYDADAIREAQAEGTEARTAAGFRDRYADGAVDAKGYRGAVGGDAGIAFNPAGRNKRSVWTVPSAPYAGAHFATFPPKLIEPCILAGSREGDTVLDPFSGAGTTGLVALRNGRSFVGIELSPEYADLARRRIIDDAPLFNAYAEAPA